MYGVLVGQNTNIGDAKVAENKIKVTSMKDKGRIRPVRDTCLILLFSKGIRVTPTVLNGIETISIFHKGKDDD